ncbi:GNAT family N-acetyltransferase [Clostridium oryzae]|uniref:Putative ribosomal N-acetyltransferase YdaF n=1 Tax=Clostridium oryzae TaxID=1450648 RepID=A0A1V4ISG7_9CLOT|nr:GNAT family protein [Clostridium oryzae]OPJ62853.1 putative ribosomal N-acetyltransferase YdaF [Clostridium oryzae]
MNFKGKNIFIRFLEKGDAEALLNLHLRNRDFFQKYSPAYSEEFYTLEWKIQSIETSIEMRKNDKMYSWGIFDNEYKKLVGTVDLFQVFRGALQSCLLGYSLDKEYNGRGYMTEAVSLVVRFAFDELKLHRIEAGVRQDNIGSMRVLEKAGFHKEGIAIKNVKINGKWEDHQMFAIISDRE